jgi:hypothetical protein
MVQHAHMRWTAAEATDFESVRSTVCSSPDQEEEGLDDLDDNTLGADAEDQSESSNSAGMELEQRFLDGAREAREAREAQENSDGDTRWEEASSGGEWADARE